MREIRINKYRYFEKDRWEDWHYEIYWEQGLPKICLKSLGECADSLFARESDSKSFSLFPSSHNRNSGLDKGLHITQKGNCLQILAPSDDDLAEIMRLYVLRKSKSP